ncbi:unnamed protein product [Penicillium salamii]|uniref:Uncharacterized protein n=1 Tax=Penicillium salamii TaxID=1612424 RepID=A0A9W4JFR1_9EURO|nr:unnamed protein product [Penicillium salamii]CAG8141221.1 unnamed protein product [Penicillium salamii]CAG8158139.1 unnamed protein product [Penicillium salamii]CAG8160294.1 unnamed protein product [Penicillium salamii]CAG8260235.1 unnamed protein product [Penicillium salamii]
MEAKIKTEPHFTPIREQWDSLKTMFPKPDMSETSTQDDDLEAQIREAQAQLAQLKKQRELIEIQQKVAEETRELELARRRLSATANSSSPLTTASKADIRPKPQGPGQGPPKKQCVARGSLPPTGPASQTPTRRSSDPSSPQTQKPGHPNTQLKFLSPKQPAKTPVKPSPNQVSITTPQNQQASTNDSIPYGSSPNLDQLRALAAATRTPSKPPTPQPLGNNTPSQPASTGKPPNPPNLPVYHGRALGEFKHFTTCIERHFDKFPEWFTTEERKVARAQNGVSLNLEDAWKHHLRTTATQNTYANFCTFLIEQLQNGVPAEFAKSRYYGCYQRSSQSISDFSNWIMQWPAHFQNHDSERDRMRHLFEHALNKVQKACEKTHLDFEHYHDFVGYLQSVEDRLERGPLSRERENPRKRPRD